VGALERLCDEYGGVYHRQPCKTCILIKGIFSGLVTPWELYRIIHANEVSLAAMNAELLDLDLTRTLPEVEVPVFFFLGRYDRHADSRLAARYFATLKAPLKQLIWFENSAHNIPFEEPQKFDAQVVKVLGEAGQLEEGQERMRRLAAESRGRI
jgi:hypothetical protein